jgi:DNA polymerase-3 subunit delta
VPAGTLVLGDEELLVARGVQRAVTAAVAAGGGDAEVHDVLAAEITPDELAELSSPSLFSEARVLVVRAAQDASKEMAAALAALAADADGGVTLIVVHAGGAEGKAIADGLKAAGARVVDAPRVKSPRDREDFVMSEVREAGGSMDRAAAADLVAYVGNDLRELSTAIAQHVTEVVPHVGAEAVAA